MKKLIIGLIILIVFATPTWAFVVTSSFGWRTHPITGKRKFHTGIDIRFAKNTPICALFDGWVVYSGNKGGYGKTVILDHGNTNYTLYGHLNQIMAQRGQFVRARQIIAYSGNTGRSTGPHLHLEYWYNGRYVNPLVLWDKNN